MARKSAKTKQTKSKPVGKKAPRAKAPIEQPTSRIYEIFGILTLASGLLLGPSLGSVQFGDGLLMGPFGQVVGRGINWLLGLCGYLMVFSLLVVALRIFAGGLGRTESGQVRHTLWRERVGVVLGTWGAAVLLHLVARPARLDTASYGGMVGEIGAEVLCSLLSTAGAWVVVVATLALALVLATNLSWARVGLWFGHRAADMGRATHQGVTSGLARAGQNIRDGFSSLVEALRRQSAAEEVSSHGTLALPPVVRLDLTNDESQPKEKKKVKPAELPQDLEIGKDEPEPEPEAKPEAQPVIRLDEDPKPAKPAKNNDNPTKTKEKNESPAEDEADVTIVEASFVEPTEETVEIAEEQPEEVQVEQTDGPGFVLSAETYKPPPLSLLEARESETSDLDREAIYEQADRLVKTLADYKIQGRITEVHPGPVVTMYEFIPAPGTRISKVAGLADDLAMSLAAQRVRIVAPIPGKGAIGIEVPNKTRETVNFKDVVASKAFRKSKAGLALAMGKNIFGAPVALDLAKMPHLLVAGATGAGKSVSINAMICSLLMDHTPEEVRMIMVDPKFLELSGYNDIPHLLLPVVTDPKKANIALRWAVNEMERRYQLLADMRVRDIRGYNRKVDKLRGKAEEELEAERAAAKEQARLREQEPSKVVVVKRNADGSEQTISGAVDAQDLENDTEIPIDVEVPNGPKAGAEAAARVNKAARNLKKAPMRLPYIVVVIDEFADLMMVASKEVETSVARLAQKARAAGLHVILATQRPSVDVITGLIKANFPSRVSFQVASTHDSKTILGCNGAENLLGAGDMLVLDRGADMKRLHGAYISDDEIQRVVDWLKEQGKPVYDMDILKADEEDEDQAAQDDEPVDAMYDQAVALVAETKNASISMIQRRLRVGYNRAARMVERMERDGIVGPPDGPRGREVLIEHHE